MLKTNPVVLRHILESNTNQVYTLHAELEGGLLAPAFDALLAGWKAQGHQLVTMGGMASRIDATVLPVQPLRWGSVSGRSGELIVS